MNDKISDYKVKVKDGDKDLDETIKIDTKKETETFHIASNGDTGPDAPPLKRSILFTISNW